MNLATKLYTNLVLHEAYTSPQSLTRPSSYTRLTLNVNYVNLVLHEASGVDIIWFSKILVLHEVRRCAHSSRLARRAGRLLFCPLFKCFGQIWGVFVEAKWVLERARDHTRES